MCVGLPSSPILDTTTLPSSITSAEDPSFLSTPCLPCAPIISACTGVKYSPLAETKSALGSVKSILESGKDAMTSPGVGLLGLFVQPLVCLLGQYLEQLLVL